MKQEKDEVETAKPTKNTMERTAEKTIGKPEKNLWQRCCGIVWIAAAFALCLVFFRDKTELTVYKAYRNLRQGFAQQYAKEWEERLEILRDESVEEVVVKPLTVLPEMLLYTDLQYTDGYYWVNEACAEYYGKVSVDLVPRE